MTYRFTEAGKEAVVYLEKEDFCGDMKTLGQIKRMVADPSVNHARIMPDCHFASSCCVGFTSKLTDKVVPRFIGGDIGCGIAAHPIVEKPDRIVKRASKFSDRIRQAVPMGDRMNDTNAIETLQDICDDARQLAARFGDSLSTPPPMYDEAWLDDFCRRTKCDVTRALRQLGSLGGGNHFIEIGVDDQTQQAYAAVHSGSRNLGQLVCHYHQDIVTNGSRKDRDTYELEVKKLHRRVKKKSERKREEDLLAEKYLVAKHPPYLEGEEAHAYYYDMVFAQTYADWNRRIMLERILTIFDTDYDPSAVIRSTHNYVDFEDGVWRKGAIRAHAGQLTLVALNMKEGILLVRGKGNPEWNHSAPHGAGRRAARGDAKRITSMAEFEKSMEGVYSDCVVPETLDESPVMYKNHDRVMALSTDTCEVVATIRPMINCKGWA